MAAGESTAHVPQVTQPLANQTQQQPLVMPIIINQDGNPNRGVQPSQGGIMNDANQLRDLISQAVSSQLQLHNIRNERNLGQEHDRDIYDRSDSMRDEEAKLSCEQQLLRKQIPINVNQHVQGKALDTAQRQSYQNPFFFTTSQQHPATMKTAATVKAPVYQSVVQPPLVMEQLLSDDADSSDIFSEDVTKSYYTQLGHTSKSNLDVNKRLVSAYERSEGEIGGPSVTDDLTSLGEVRFPSNPKSLAGGGQYNS